MTFRPRAATEWKLRTRNLQLGCSTAIMGILNVTPDSFSDGGRFRSSSEAVEAALQMLQDGATIIDIGGESTRPGTYRKISPRLEADRVLPVIEGILKARPEALLSIDTYHAATAAQAIQAGVEIVNDVSGFLWDPQMSATCAAMACGVVLMHTRGGPEEWSTLPTLQHGDVVILVLNELRERLGAAVAAGMEPSRLVLDPGFGFGKAFDENFPLLAHLGTLLTLGHPILAGVSRKGFLGRNVPPGERTHQGLAAMTAAILSGASMVRVHDVKASVEAAAIADAILLAT